MVQPVNIPTLSPKGVSSKTGLDGHVELPVVPSLDVHGAFLIEDGGDITIESTLAKNLKAGDLLYLAVPLLPYKVIDNQLDGFLGGLGLRSRLTLIDATGERRDLKFVPERRCYVIVEGSMGLAPWSGLPLSYITSQAKEDTFLSRVTDPVWRYIKGLVRAVLDMQCYFFSMRLQGSLLLAMCLVVAVAVGLASRTPTPISVAISIIGAFALERIWYLWRHRVRRRLAKGFVLRIRYRSAGKKMKYGRLHIRPEGAMILGEDLKAWFTTKLVLCKNGKDIASFTFANDIRGDQSYTGRRIADAIRHRTDDGFTRVLHCNTVRYDPDKDENPNTTINTAERLNDFMMVSPDDRSGQPFTLRFKRFQMRILADALEVMDQGRTL